MIEISVKKVNLNRLKNKYKQTIERLPPKLGATAVRYIHENFTKQGYVDQGVRKWKKRKSKKHQGRAVLIKSGALRRDIRVRRTTKTYAVVGTSLPHANIHNQGGTINHPGGTPFFVNDEGDTVFVSRVVANAYEAKTGRRMRRTKPHRINMPQRQFMPTKRRPSRTLNKRLRATTQRELKKIK
uniref:phage virion morphogenesis protein n=1 Tax=uncultured Draconibacterium sp. TaxID=1573823 RepID=UPI0032169844